ncbi:hypothetical protein [Cohnella silvisoli]|uniref:Uncharacterized protein n=1 Tax=Cohnella silvisoli TaxID=2873699 RepID=A0ABV1KL33_9BACL|nr:hypothetical protein [Cohnella silvisoli]MCD9020809.1 hypothetical protein [Cohnella silvisoli]
MKNKVRTLGITAAIAVMIPLTAYAATTSSDSTTGNKAVSAVSVKGDALDDRGGFGRQKQFVSQEVLDLLKLDKAAFNEKIKAGMTLAKIAEGQGVSRDSLKKAMTDSFNKKLEERKKDFADNLDKMIDSDLQVDIRGGGFRAPLDFSAAAKVLGLSADQVKEQLSAGKSLADLATDKGVDVQKLIDAEKTALTSSINQAVKDGKLTQTEADKQLKDVANIAEKIVNGKGFGEGHRHGGGHGRGFGGEKPSDAEAAEPSASS